MRLYETHPRALTTLFAETEAHAFSQTEVFVGTAGSVMERSNAAGYRFYAHQFYDAFGQKRERYLAGPLGSTEADALAQGVRTRIEDLRTILPSLRLLGREGFQIADSRAFATLAALANRGLFSAGSLLVGSHAYGVLLNKLGIRAPAYGTEDIDIARAAPLEFSTPGKRRLLDVLRESGIEFVEVPQLDSRYPATSFKQKGRSTFQVDLLAPSRGETIGSIRVPELDAHALTLPYLGYLLGESQLSVFLAREGCCAVRVPVPERFAIHKLIVSMLRTGRDAKSLKDREQAALLIAAMAELHPGAIESAVEKVPRGARRILKRAIGTIRQQLETNHPRAWQALEEAMPGS